MRNTQTLFLPLEGEGGQSIFEKNMMVGRGAARTRALNIYVSKADVTPSVPSGQLPPQGEAKGLPL